MSVILGKGAHLRINDFHWLNSRRDIFCALTIQTNLNRTPNQPGNHNKDINRPNRPDVVPRQQLVLGMGGFAITTRLLLGREFDASLSAEAE